MGDLGEGILFILTTGYPTKPGRALTPTAEDVVDLAD